MKRIMSLILLFVVAMTTVVSADVVPVAISALPFDLEQDGDVFTIILNENQTTGYAWVYTVKDSEHVKFISDEFVVESELIGAGGQHKYTFEVLKDGVSVIDFEYKRSFEENSTIESIPVLVYKNGEKVFIEENQIVTINDEVKSYSVETVNGVKMLPLAEILRDKGYEVTWDGQTQSIEISKGAQWTKITIGQNSYFKNRMAARPLSAAPALVEGKTYVPAEFFVAILDLAFEIKEDQVVFNDMMVNQLQGYVKEIVTNKDQSSILLSYDKDMMNIDLVVHVSIDNTFIQKYVKEGTPVNVVTSMATTMSLPPQTAGYIIY